MNLEITGKLAAFLPEQSGQGKNGPWVKQEVIMDTEEQFPKKVCIACWGDKASAVKSYSIGEKLRFGINIESREFNGRWYTDVKAWRIERANQSSEARQQPAPLIEEQPYDGGSGDDDLPF
jgi:hypothetical protein